MNLQNVNLQESVKIDQLSVDECLQNSGLSASTCVTYKRKINDMHGFVFMIRLQVKKNKNKLLNV